MEQLQNVLMKTELFRGVDENDVKGMLQCLQARSRSYRKGELIYHMGEVVEAMGVVIDGIVIIEKSDVWGNTSILEVVERGEVFAETYACVPEEPLMVNVIAYGDSEVLFLNTGKMFRTCSPVCAHHSRLIQNLLRITAQKNLTLSRKISHTASKSIRGRVLAYLSFQAVKHGNVVFEIPFNRQQLADYLGVDRSALSNELSKMQKEGLLTFQKNTFCLKTESVV